MKAKLPRIRAAKLEPQAPRPQPVLTPVEPVYLLPWMPEVLPLPPPPAPVEKLVQLPTVGPRAKAAGGSARGSHHLALALCGCELKFALNVIAKLKPKKVNEHFVLGTLVHDLLAYHYASALPADRQPQWYKDQSLETALEEDCEGLPKLIETAREVFRDYADNWLGEQFTILGIEQSFSLTVGELDPGGPDPTLDAEVVTWKADLLALSRDHVDLVDHKTAAGDFKTKRLAAWHDANEFHRSWQVLYYLYAMRIYAAKMGWPWPVEAFEINRLKKYWPFDYDRHNVHVAELPYRHVGRMVRRAVAADREIRAKAARGEELSPNYSMCWQGNYPCDFATICWTNNAEQRDRVMQRDFVQG